MSGWSAQLSLFEVAPRAYEDARNAAKRLSTLRRYEDEEAEFLDRLVGREDDLLRMAGCIDSDGSIGIWIQGRGRTSQGKTPVYSEGVALGQTTRVYQELAVSLFGGSLRTRSYPTNVARAPKPMHHWAVSDKTAARVCLALRPFLLIKHDRAELCLQLRALKRDPALLRIRGKSTKSPLVVEAMHDLYVQSTRLNGREPQSLAAWYARWAAS